MRYCTKCGKKITNDAIYCPYCKTAVQHDKTAILKVLFVTIVGFVILFGICKGCYVSSYKNNVEPIEATSNELF